MTQGGAVKIMRLVLYNCSFNELLSVKGKNFFDKVNITLLYYLTTLYNFHKLSEMRLLRCV